MYDTFVRKIRLPFSYPIIQVKVPVSQNPFEWKLEGPLLFVRITESGKTLSATFTTMVISGNTKNVENTHVTYWLINTNIT